MKTNAIARIVIFSLLITILVGVLLVSLGIDQFGFTPLPSTENVIKGEEISLKAADVNRLELEWAAGTITILAADTDQISFYETGEFSGKYTMTYSLDGGVLSIDYANGSVSIGFGSIPSKDLTIIVPQDWLCKGLELDGAALEVDINGLNVIDFDIDGAANKIQFIGSFQELECDGAACELTLNCQERPNSINLDGASIELDLILPAECGFLVQMSGLSCIFRSDLDYISGNGDYMYGDRNCKVYADGISCAVTINHAPSAMEIE